VILVVPEDVSIDLPVDEFFGDRKVIGVAPVSPTELSTT